METKENHITIIAIVAIVGIVGIVLGIYSINKSSASLLTSGGEEDLVGGAVSKKCVDGDGGQDYYTQAKTCVGTNCKADICSTKVKGTLTEYYCQTSKDRGSTNYQCPAGCSGGACVHPDSCKDSDNGKDYFTQGIVSGYYGNQYYQYQEYCYDSNNLVEYSCDGSNPTKDLVSCPNGCQDGACLVNPQRGYRFATWICYDGYNETQGSETSCKTSETWQRYSEESCDGHCYTDGSKCGVNSFSVSDECALS